MTAHDSCGDALHQSWWAVDRHGDAHPIGHPDDAPDGAHVEQTRECDRCGTIETRRVVDIDTHASDA